MTRRRIHILLALTLLICGICPFVEEFVLDWNQSIFDTGYDGESTVAVIALVFILAFALAHLLGSFVPESTTEEPVFARQRAVSSIAGFGIKIPDASPPLALRV